MSNFMSQHGQSTLDNHKFAADMRLDAMLYDADICLAGLQSRYNGTELVGPIEDLRASLKGERKRIERLWL